MFGCVAWVLDCELICGLRCRRMSMTTIAIRFDLQEAIMDPAKPGSVEDKVQDQMEAGKSEVSCPTSCPFSP